MQKFDERRAFIAAALGIAAAGLEYDGLRRVGKEPGAVNKVLGVAEIGGGIVGGLGALTVAHPVLDEGINTLAPELDHAMGPNERNNFRIALNEQLPSSQALIDK